MKNYKNAPDYLSHTPIITVDYESKDANAGDAKFLSLGYATWTKDLPDGEKDFSAKVWRKANERWSRQSEELPFWRVLDLAILLTATIKEKESYLEEFVQKPERINGLKKFLKLKKNKDLYEPRLEELKRLLE